MVTSALPYANGPIHIGHLAGAYLPADIYVRYLRLKGEDVVYACGSDEHGVPITLQAKKKGVSPQQIVDEYHELNKESFKNFGIAFDIYHRTSAQLHHETASQFFEKLYTNNEFIEKESEQFFDEENQQFLADRYISGTCPKCSYDSAYGDQCEQCGSSLSPKELINPKSTISGNLPILKKTKHWYIPLDKYQEEWLNSWIEGHQKDWKPTVYGQCKSWLDQGLKPRAVTRDLDWGVKVPIPEEEGKVLYVWFDAPIGYISATKAWAKEQGIDWKPYWQDEDTKLVHFIGKDNIVFHCIIFPAMLKVHGDFILPENVPANEFLNLEGDKLSTSRNRAVWLHEYLDNFPGKEDALRYVLCANMPEAKDNDFSWKDFQAKNNNELVANLGNFINRTLVLTEKYCNCEVPTIKSSFSEEVAQTLADILQSKKRIEELIEHFKFREALSELMKLSQKGNKFLADSEPWNLIKTDEEKVKFILFACLQITAALGLLMRPFLPNTSIRILRIIGLEDNEIAWDDIGSSSTLAEGTKLNKIELLFEKIDDEVIEREVEKLSNELLSGKTKGKPMIKFEDFTKLDMRTGTILTAEKVEGADKLIQLSVDLGSEKRVLVAGIAEQYDVASIIGQQVCVLANLEPKKIRGIESHGMVMMAEDEDGNMAFLSPSKSLNDGSNVC